MRQIGREQVFEIWTKKKSLDSGERQSTRPSNNSNISNSYRYTVAFVKIINWCIIKNNERILDHNNSNLKNII